MSTNRGTTMALAACSLTAAPLFLAPTGSQQKSAQTPSVHPALRGNVPAPGAGAGGSMMAASFGGMALVVASLGHRRQSTTKLVRTAEPESAAESESPPPKSETTATKEDAPPPPPPPPPPFDPSKQVGAMAPLGFFDPAGFAKLGDKEGFNNLRAAEIKHGRVAMMAALGGVVQHFVKFPGFEKVPAGFSAVTTAPGSFGFIALLAVSAGLELAVWTQDPEKEPGNFGNPVGWGSYDDEMRNKEINNGRFAMFAALGIIAADLLTGKDAVQQLGV